MNFKDMEIAAAEVEESKVLITSDYEATVRAYLPIEEKGNLITWIVNRAIDDRTGNFSPLRTEVYFSLAVLKWYADIEVDAEDVPTAYDTFEKNGVISAVIDAIPSDEFEFLHDLVLDTIDDISRYNTSFAGILSMMSNDASGLGDQVDSILESIRNKEGLEQLAVIKDVVGTD